MLPLWLQLIEHLYQPRDQMIVIRFAFLNRGAGRISAYSVSGLLVNGLEVFSGAGNITKGISGIMRINMVQRTGFMWIVFCLLYTNQSRVTVKHVRNLYFLGMANGAEPQFLYNFFGHMGWIENNHGHFQLTLRPFRSNLHPWYIDNTMTINNNKFLETITSQRVYGVIKNLNKHFGPYADRTRSHQMVWDSTDFPQSK